MTKTLRRLLTRTFDYAGVFPPARLQLGDAFRNYLDYWRSADSWMLRRFLCLPTQLVELERISVEYPDVDQYLDVGVIGRPSQGMRDFLEVLDADLQALVRFGRNPHATPKPTLDLRLPPVFDPVLFGLAFEKISAASREIGPIVAYFEAKVTNGLREQVLKPLAQCMQLGQYVLYVGGFKLRCGGEEASAVPTPAQVAHAIACCREHTGLDLKLTAGLHHPIRRFDPGLQTQTHGFINILTAALLAKSHHQLSEARLVEIIADSDASHFKFDDDGCGWKDLRVSLQEMKETPALIVAIGSCSFDEPREDLKTLGWW